MSKINILHIIDKFSMDGQNIHGVTRVLSWWIPRFNKERYNLIVCGLKHPDPASRALEDLGLKVLYLGRGKLNPITAIDLLKVIKKEKIDILHLHGYGACNFGRIAAIISKTPALLHEHAAFPRVPLHQVMADYILAKFISETVANCSSVAEFCIKKRSIPSENVKVIFNGIPLDEFKMASHEDIEKEKQRLNIPPDYKIVGTVARLHEQKGINYFIEAMPEVLNSCPKTKFLIVGDGHLRGELEERCKQLNLQHHVVFTGQRKDIPLILSLLDIKVISSVYEGTTLTVFETMAVGKPIISTDVDGLREVIEDGKTALVVPPKDVKVLAQKIIYLLKNKEEAERLGANAREEGKKYDIDSSVRKIEKLYDKLYDSKNHNLSSTYKIAGGDFDT
jgi:glycosyltransferase involved in cell wall biosynthesis